MLEHHGTLVTRYQYMKAIQAANKAAYEAEMAERAKQQPQQPFFYYHR